MTMASTFVGREAELSMLASLSVRAQRERLPAAAVVIGDPGSGKSRLLEEAASRSPIDRSIRVVGFEPEAGIPLAAARELLETLKNLPGAGSILRHLLEGGSGTGVEPLRVFEAAHRSLEPLLPVMIQADDVHWADTTSLALLHYLVRAADAEGLCVVVVAAARSAPGPESFARSLRQLVGDRSVTMELGPLGHEESVRLVIGANPGLDQRQADEVVRLARGTPFWLELLARTGSRGDIQAVLTERLRGAGADAVDVIATLALAGRPLLVDEVTEIHRWGGDRVLEASRDLARSGLVVQREGFLSLAHDLVREAAADRLPPPHRRRTHRRLAEWLERQGDGDQAMMLSALEHRLAGGLPGLDLAARLARSTRRGLMGANGVRLLGGLADDAGPAGSDLAVEVAQLASDVGDHEEALNRWAALADRSPDPQTRVTAALEASRAAYHLERADAARSYLERATAGAGGDPVCAVEVEAHRSEILRWLEHRRDRADASTRRALRMARALAAEAGWRLEPAAPTSAPWQRRPTSASRERIPPGCWRSPTRCWPRPPASIPIRMSGPSSGRGTACSRWDGLGRRRPGSGSPGTRAADRPCTWPRSMRDGGSPGPCITGAGWPRRRP
jgi:hypothetical protein